MPRRKTIAITGASGLIGKHLCRYFRQRGWQVRALMRTPDERFSGATGIREYVCDLPHRIDPRGLRGSDIVLHAAYSTRDRDLRTAAQINEDGSRRLFELAAEEGVRKIVFLSSFSARADALSYYGRSKHAVEAYLNPSRDLSIRLGLVLAGDGGLFQRICASMRGSRVVPLVGGSRIVQTLHIDDLCLACDRAIERNMTGLLSVAEPDGLPFREFLRLVAREFGGRRFVPVPIPPALLALRCIESLGFRPGVSVENLLGIRMLEHVSVDADLAQLGINVRSAADALADLFCPESLTDQDAPARRAA